MFFLYSILMENSIQLIGTIFSVLTALIAIYIAYRQYANDTYRIKIDLFEKRFSLYSQLHEVLIKCQAGPIDDHDGYQIGYSMNDCNRLSKFLFEKELQDEIEKLRQDVLEVLSLYRKLNGDNKLPDMDSRRPDLASEKYDLTRKLSNAQDGLVELFNRQMYLGR